MRLGSCAARDGWGDQTVLFLKSAGVTQAGERVLAVAFRNKLCWFESHYRHISLCSSGNTQHSQKTDIHAPGGIGTHNLSRRVAVVRPATGTGEVSHLCKENENTSALKRAVFRNWSPEPFCFDHWFHSSCHGLNQWWDVTLRRSNFIPRVWHKGPYLIAISGREDRPGFLHCPFHLTPHIRDGVHIRGSRWPVNEFDAGLPR